MKNKKSLLMLIILFILLVCQTIFLSNNVYAYTQTQILEAGKMLWSTYKDSTSSVSTISDDALLQYAKNGVFGEACKNNCDTATTSSQVQACCPDAYTYKEANEQYANYASLSLKENDKDSSRLNSAMATFNEHAHFVYSFLSGFGCLTSLLVFILIFLRITWLPEHALQRRRAMEDVVVAGIATILLGGFWLVIGVFQSMFNRFWETYTVYTKDWQTAGNIALSEYRMLIVGILGIATLTAFLMFVKNITGIIVVGTNPQKKRDKMVRLLYTGFATTGLGCLTIFTGFFWNMLQ